MVFMHIEFDFITSLEFNLSSFIHLISFILYRMLMMQAKNAAQYLKFVSDIDFKQITLTTATTKTSMEHHKYQRCQSNHAHMNDE